MEEFDVENHWNGGLICAAAIETRLAADWMRPVNENRNHRRRLFCHDPAGLDYHLLVDSVGIFHQFHRAAANPFHFSCQLLFLLIWISLYIIVFVCPIQISTRRKNVFIFSSLSFFFSFFRLELFFVLNFFETKMEANGLSTTTALGFHLLPHHV